LTKDVRAFAIIKGIFNLNKMENLLEKIDLLVDVFEAVKKNEHDDKHSFAIIKLRHLKNDLQQLAKDNPNDFEYGKLMRKLINQ
jgi:hypothetical protein